MGTWRHVLRRTALAAAAGAFLAGVLPGWAGAQTTPKSEGPLTVSLSVTQTGDYVTGGVGLRARQEPLPGGAPVQGGSGTIVIADYPTTPVTVTRAFLYWAIVASAEEPAFAMGTVNGTNITGDLIAVGAAPCEVGAGFSTFVYREDVTAIAAVSGNGPYVLTNFASGTATMPTQFDEFGESKIPPINLGATLVVLYSQTGLPSRVIQIYDGVNPVNIPGQAATTQLTFPAIAAAGTVKTTYVVGAGQNQLEDETRFNGTVLASNVVDEDLNLGNEMSFNGGDGSSWDTDTYNVAIGTVIQGGATTANVSVVNLGDCLVHVAQVVSAPLPTGPEPVTVVLTPPVQTRVVGENAVVTATVEGAVTGQPVPGVTVQFTTTSGATGSCTTNASGTCVFTFTVELPNTVVVTGTTTVNGTPASGEATVVFIPPASTPDCEVKITNGGWIVTLYASQGTFGGNAKTDALGNVLFIAGMTGNEEFQDHGAQNVNMHGQPKAVTCTPDRRMATIFGQGTVNGIGSFWWRIRVTDNGEPGNMDIYGIIVANGYCSGDKPLMGGNVQIH